MRLTNMLASLQIQESIILRTGQTGYLYLDFKKTGKNRPKCGQTCFQETETRCRGNLNSQNSITGVVWSVRLHSKCLTT